MTDIVTRICDFTADALAGSGLTFAVIIWKPNQADLPDSIAIQTPVASEGEALTACRTAADCLEKQFRKRVIS